MPGMGFRHVEDPRDKRYPFRLALDPHRQIFPHGLEGSSYQSPGHPWDQGDTGTCVEHGIRHAIEAGPIKQKLPLAQYDFYRFIVPLDEFKDNDFEATAPTEQLQSGTTVRAGLDGGVKLGLYKSYLWAESIEDVRQWLLAKLGPVVIGVEWKSEMMETDTEGFVNVKGQVEGGHCVMLYGWNDHIPHNGKREQGARAQQSWKLPWGDRGTGRMWISREGLESLFEGGEFGAPTEVRVKPVEKPSTTMWDYLRPGGKPTPPEPY